MIVRMADYGQFFATRALAKRIISEQIEALPASEAVVLDWTGVEAVTGAFASELVAWFLRAGRRVESRGANDEVGEAWETAVQRLEAVR